MNHRVSIKWKRATQQVSKRALKIQVAQLDYILVNNKIVPIENCNETQNKSIDITNTVSAVPYNKHKII